MANKDELIIGVDFGEDGDYSCASSICGNCKRVIDSIVTLSGNKKANMTLYKSCPYCGIEFKQFVITE